MAAGPSAAPHQSPRWADMRPGGKRGREGEDPCPLSGGPPSGEPRPRAHAANTHALLPPPRPTATPAGSPRQVTGGPRGGDD
eukprot:scaffold1780_cov215-Prasinococcus_capsulatus_cf.AAC.3